MSCFPGPSAFTPATTSGARALRAIKAELSPGPLQIAGATNMLLAIA